MTETEETLRYWLAQEDWYPSRYTQDFLDNSPVDIANETLARIAADAQPEPHSYPALLYNAFATVGFMPSAGGKMPRRKAGVRAALLLAQRNDPRCVPALTRVFETEGVWQNKYQDQIAAALTRYLSVVSTSDAIPEYASNVGALATRIWGWKPNRDLSPAFARLQLVMVRFLHGANSTDPILRTIAFSNSQMGLRQRVSETARSLLDNDIPSR